MRNLLKKYQPELISTGLITQEQFNNDLFDWLVSKGDNQQIRNDFIWSLLNRFLLDVALKATSEHELYENQRKIYLMQFGLLNDEGKNITHVHSLLNKCNLNLANLSPLYLRADLITKGCCKECEAYDLQEKALQDELKKPTLPIQTCTRSKGCICSYGFHGVRNEKDKLILK